MLSWFLNPWMLMGGLAVASPILIHLLNKRRFKIVDWAAMDFLFQADKKNRRRVQLENFILLLLRCLAMLLLALMLARPFLPAKVTNVLQQAQKLERVILIDDSLSQSVLNGTLPTFDVTKEGVKNLIAEHAESDETEDWLTVMLTSRPNQPLLSNEPLTKSTLPSLSQAIDELECSDMAADYLVSLGEVKRYVSGQRENVGRVSYLFSDMRERDWINSLDADSAPNKLVNEIAESTVGSFVIDIGSANDQNLAITSVRPENLQVADKVIQFNVTVANYGTQTVNQVRVLLQIDDGQPDYEVIPSLAPGQESELAFRYVFPRKTVQENLLAEEKITTGFTSYKVRAEIDRQSLGEEGLSADQLLDDSSALFAARVLDGISVLLVDGDPSASSERSETHYLNSLSVAGTGLSMNVITVSELETVSLSDYQAIFLCNVDEASPDRVKSLESWVRDGGALVFMPGNRVRAATFNDSFYRDGQGISPLGLDSIAGDSTMAKWVNFEIDPQMHPALRIIVESDASSLSNVDVFSWWTSEMPKGQVGKTVSVPLRLSDENNSPAMVDRTFGNGNVIVFTIPGDGDWTMWPSSPTFPPVMIDLIDYLVGTSGEQSEVELSSSISYPVDISAFESRVSLRDPKNEKVEAVARPQDESEEAKASVMYQVKFDDIRKRGFYDLELTRHAGEKKNVLFSANVDPKESQLKRLSTSALEGDFFSDNVKMVGIEDLKGETVSGGNTEIWPQLLVFLFGILVLEQFLGWFWGKKR